MTNQNSKPELFVVDGSNIATEGRSKPSLEQLNEAVAAFREEYPDVDVTVVVDATFGHRIAKGEVKAFDKAVANNELVTPPAGAVGRGDAFILAIADKANAGVFSNDSFQEFHGDYGWLFEHGRLIGGKPVPHVGWVFVDRNPVRGPKSRESIRAAKKAESADEPPTAAKEKAQRRVRKKKAAAAEPSGQSSDEQTGTAPTETKRDDDAASSGSKRGRGRGRGRGRQDADQQPDAKQDGKREEKQEAVQSGSTKHVNELAPFLNFVEQHAVGQSITATVASYSSHGAYADFGDVQVYIPLRLMADPAPTSARKAVTIGDDVEVVVAAFSPDRRSIDVALPAMADRIERPKGQTGATDEGPESKPKKRRAARRRGKKAAAESSEQTAPSTEQTAPSTEQTAPSTEQAAEAADAPAPEKKAPAKKKAAAKKAPAKKKAAAKKAPAKKQAPAKKAPAKKRAARKQAAAPAASETTES